MDFLYLVGLCLLGGTMLGGFIALLVWLPLPVAIFAALAVIYGRARR
jgi:hypothetical protein